MLHAGRVFAVGGYEPAQRPRPEGTPHKMHNPQPAPTIIRTGGGIDQSEARISKPVIVALFRALTPATRVSDQAAQGL